MKTQENVKPVDIRPFAYAISLIDGKWKMHILFWLWKQETSVLFPAVRDILVSPPAQLTENRHH